MFLGENFTIGVDIQEISSLEDYPYMENKEFYERVFLQSERDYCLSKAFPAQHFAARFAGKEAIIKAISPFATLSYEHIEIRNDDNMRPYVILGPPLNEAHAIKISLSHSDTQAIAFAVVERK